MRSASGAQSLATAGMPGTSRSGGPAPRSTYSSSMSPSSTVGTAGSADGGHRPAALDVAQQLLGALRAPAARPDEVAGEVADAREPVAGLVVGGEVLAEQQGVGRLAQSLALL